MKRCRLLWLLAVLLLFPARRVLAQQSTWSFAVSGDSRNPPAPTQQVKTIDLTTTTQRVQLRFPPPPKVEHGYGSGGGMGSVSDCAADIRDPRSLTVSLVNATARNDAPKRRFQVVFKVLNTGRAPIQVPVSPHLSDLQPNDPSKQFSYLSLALSVSPVERRDSIGYVELYGGGNLPDTLMMLSPGEWLLVKADVDLRSDAPPVGTLYLTPGYSLQQVTFHASPGGFSSDAESICINSMPSPQVLVMRDDR